MRLIAITPEDIRDNERDYICRILDSGFDYVHLRKPSHNIDDMRKILDELPVNVIPKLKLHSFFELVNEYDLAGVHLNSRYNSLPCNIRNNIKISKSCHSIEELNDCQEYEYVFLSPIFDSISKTGYTSKFNLEDLSKVFHADSAKNNIIALGGVIPEYLAKLKDCGFSGAAFLGYLFNSHNITELNKALHKIQQSI